MTEQLTWKDRLFFSCFLSQTCIAYNFILELILLCYIDFEQLCFHFHLSLFLNSCLTHWLCNMFLASMCLCFLQFFFFFGSWFLVLYCCNQKRFLMWFHYYLIYVPCFMGLYIFFPRECFMCIWKNCVFCCFWMELMGMFNSLPIVLLVSMSFVLVDIHCMFTFPYVRCIYIYNCYILYRLLKHCVLSFVSYYCLCFKLFCLILVLLP